MDMPREKEMTSSLKDAVDWAKEWENDILSATPDSLIVGHLQTLITHATRQAEIVDVIKRWEAYAFKEENLGIEKDELRRCLNEMRIALNAIIEGE